MLRKTYLPNSRGVLTERYLVQCNVCGNKKYITKHNHEKEILDHNRTNCKENYLDWWIGKKTGDYIVESRDGDRYKIRCSICGVVTNVDLQSLQRKSDHTHGTFCMKQIPESNIKTTILRRYGNMRQRCCNEKNTNFSHYGKRNIQIKYDNAIDLYMDFYDEFAELEKQGNDISKYTFDRIDVNGNYEKDNLRLVEQKIQSTNTTRKKVFIVQNGEDKVICDSAMEFGRVFGINGRSLGNVVRGKSKSAGGWKLVKVLSGNENIDEVIINEGVTTNLIIS